MSITQGNNTRFDISKEVLEGEGALPSGYGDSPSESFTIPSCEIEDVDGSVHALFDTHIGFKNIVIPDGANGPENINKPYVIFAVGERFALVKKLRPPRTKDKSLMLPAISIRRMSITQSLSDMSSRGMNQSTGNIIIKRRLAREDRDYQNLINKLLLENLNPGNATSSRPQGEFGSSRDSGTRQGLVLSPKIGNNIWEIISIPQPQFYTAKYEITIWTTHTQHMNYLISTLLSAQLPQGKNFRLNTPKGYWFLATVDEQLGNAENFDDFTEEKRIIRYTFQMDVRAWLLAPNNPGNPVPVRRYLSAVDISFDTVIPTGNVLDQSQVKSLKKSDSDYSLSDIEEDPLLTQKETTNQKFLVDKKTINPQSGKQEIQRAKILETNQKSGEIVYFTEGFQSLDEFILSLGYK